jgi:hypothetical protein
MTPEDAHADFWRLDAGLRYLRMIDPDDAEYNYAFDQENHRLLEELVNAGKLKPFGGEHNVIRRQSWGAVRYITNFSGGDGRSWPSEIPDGYKTLPTIEPKVPEPSALTAVQDYLTGIATRLLKDKASIETGRDALQRLEAIRSHRAQLWLPSDLSVLHSAGSSPLRAKWRAQTAITIMDFLDNVTPSNSVENYAGRLSRAYFNAGISGILYWPLVLMSEIADVAKPNWPFGEGVPPYVCGQPNCRHRICQQNIQNIVADSSGAEVLGVPVQMPDPNVYFLKNVADLEKILASCIQTAGDTRWIEQAAKRLLNRGETERKRLDEAESVLDFYTLHFRFLPFLKAAELGFDLVISYSRTTNEQERLKALKNRAEEWYARSVAALSFDFSNAIDHKPLLTMRAQYEFYREQSRIAAGALLQKWVADDTFVPIFWQDFIAGRSDGFPIGVRKRAT